MKESKAITFSFGENWQAFLSGASEESFKAARSDIEEWLGPERLKGKRVLDIGSGSGIHSAAFFSMGAAEVVSFDLDPRSVAATSSLWEKAGRPSNWRVLEGSVLDRAFLDKVGREQFDLVYSWGVLHHTGSMWEAIGNAFSMVKPGALCWIALYILTREYPAELKLKQRYNGAPKWLKRLMEARFIARIAAGRLVQMQNPLAWNQRVMRGMDVFHDIVDWLGGLPYEAASEEQVVKFGREHGFNLEAIRTFSTPGSNSIYLLSRTRK